MKHSVGRELDLLIPEKEKYEEHSNQGSIRVRNLVGQYELLGQTQVQNKRSKNRKLYNHYYGVINKDEYIDEIPEDLSVTSNNELEDVNLMYFPIIPVICNGIEGEYDKKVVEYSLRAINPENTNAILEEFDSQLRESMARSATQLFLMENPNITEEQYKQFQESERIQKIMKTTYRTSVEGWGTHIMQVQDAKFSLKELEKKALRQILVTDDPTLVVITRHGEYFPLSLNEENTFSLKPIDSEDYSEGMMFGWFEYSNIGSIINTHSSELDAYDLEKLKSWGQTSLNFDLKDQHDADFFTGNKTSNAVSSQNYDTMHHMFNSNSNDFDESYDGVNNTIRKSSFFFLLPRKKGLLTLKTTSGVLSETVDEYYEITQKAVYELKKPKTANYLLEGEHIDWYYDNELWFAETLNYNTFRGEGFNTFGNNLGGAKDDNGEHSTIWIRCEKYDIQYSDFKSRYGIRLPVNGGSMSNRHSPSLSLVEKCIPWQIFYNWIWNRNFVLAAGEIGKFYAVEPGVIPTESLEESWAKDALTKFAVTARDVGMVELDKEEDILGRRTEGNIGQIVDLNKTNDIIEKANLARMIKIECYQLVGLSEEYLYGNVQPRMSAELVRQGNQRSSAQIQWIFNRLNDVIKRFRLTLLETEQALTIINGESTISYTGTDDQREIFKMSPDELITTVFDMFIKSNLSDIDALKDMQSYVLNNNTLGIDAFELATIRTENNIPELMQKLKTFREEKLQRDREERQHQQQMQEQQLQARQAELEKTLLLEEQSKEKDRQKDIMVAQIRALAGADDDASAIQDEIIRLQNENTRQREFYDKLGLQSRIADFKIHESRNKQQQGKEDAVLKEKIEMKKLQQKDRELDIRDKERIASEKRTNVIK